MVFLERSLLLTLSYTDQFDFPLTLEEIFFRLVRVVETQKTSKELIKKYILNLKNREFIEQSGEYFFLRGREKIVLQRKEREKNSDKMWDEVEFFKRICRYVPWVKGVLVTGALAMNNAPANDDFDFLVVTQKNRLWLVRPLFFLISMVVGKARRFGTVRPGSWCFNLWLEEDVLELSDDRKNLYGAYETLQAVIIYGGNFFERSWLKSNSWTRDFLPNFYEERLNQCFEIKDQKPTINFLDIFSLIFAVLNWSAYVLQTTYMHSHKTSEDVSLKRAFFHPADMRSRVTPRWKRSLERLKEFVWQ